MKYLGKFVSALILCLPLWLSAQTQVTYSLDYDHGTQTYTVSMTSNNAYNPPLSRLTSSTQVTIVVPQVAGGWQVSNLTELTDLEWGFSFLDGTTEGLSDDYLFFAPSNAGTYTPFSIPVGASIPLFSFQSGSGCVGDLSLFDNVNDPLNGVPTINADNNMVILGAGPGNVYAGNDSGNVPCAALCEANAGTLSY